MTREEAIKILQRIAATYARFDLSDDKNVDIWLEALEDMSYPLVRARLKEHTRLKIFPPVIAEIAAYDAPENDFLDRQKEWRRDAEKRIQRDRASGYVPPRPPWES
ncbi:replicative helicase loader/inhibitor [Bacillus sp. 03113]|uniref:replicative helicase loader/inhibitor n=1 Tax=Bacillus sp. 03113 TaxID=2578211 RepID=UPI0015E8AADA|nr:replicative helicase loader/inhibitor [Bacillus sp. 03113]